MSKNPLIEPWGSRRNERGYKAIKYHGCNPYGNKGYYSQIAELAAMIDMGKSINTDLVQLTFKYVIDGSYGKCVGDMMYPLKVTDEEK